MSKYSIETIFRAIDKYSRPLKKMTIQNKKFTNAIKKDFAKAQRQVANFGINLKNALKTGVLVAGAAAVAGIGYAIKTMVTEAAKLENITTEFKVLTGGMENAKKLVGDLRMLSAKTPMQFEGIADSTKLLMAFGIEQEKVVDVVKMLGDAALGDQQKLMTLSRAYGKVIAKGKVSMEEINMVTDASVPIMKDLAKQITGGDVIALQKLISQGKITAEMFQESFERMTGAGGKFYNGMLEKSTTLTGMWSTFKDIVSIMAGNFGELLLPILKDFLQIITNIGLRVIEWVKQNKELIKVKFEKFVDVLKKAFIFTKNFISILYKVAMVLKPLAPIIMGIIIAFYAYKTALFLAAIAQWAMNVAMSANPVGIIIVAVGVLIGLIILMILHWDKVSVAVTKFYEKAKPILMLLFPTLIILIELIKAIAQNWDNIKSAFKEKGIIGGILAIGKALLIGVLGPIQAILEMLSKIPGVGEKIGNMNMKLSKFKEGLFDSNAPITQGDRYSYSKEEKITKGELTIKDKTKNTEIKPKFQYGGFDMKLQKSGGF